MKYFHGIPPNWLDFGNILYIFKVNLPILLNSQD